MTGSAGVASATASRGDRAIAGRGLTAVGFVVALFLGLPVAALVVRSLLEGALREAFADPVILDALVLSLITTSIALVLSLVLGLPLAMVLARRRFRGAALV